MLTKLKSLWKLPDLRNRILLTIGILFIARLLSHIPAPGIPKASLEALSNSQFFGLLDLFSGGSVSRLSIAMLGVGPYITASIIFQLLTYVIPSLEALQKEGEYGRQKLNQYQRYITVPLAALQTYATLALMRSQGLIGSIKSQDLVLLGLTTIAGTMFLMWLGEVITERGIGNGISLLITLGIISRLPLQAAQALALAGIDINSKGIDISNMQTSQMWEVIGFGAAALVVLAGVIFMTEGIRNIPVTYARGIRRGVASAAQSNLPIRVNSAGVIPIIFAISLMVFPSFVAQMILNSKFESLKHIARGVVTATSPTSPWYAIIYFLMVVLFTFFYTSVVFQPKKIAENLQKQSGFIPGIRPGMETEHYLGKIIYRITLGGAAFLGIVAVLPALVQQFTGVSAFTLGGTGILIVVAVVIETMRAIRAQVITHTYEKY